MNVVAQRTFCRRQLCLVNSQASHRRLTTARTRDNATVKINNNALGPCNGKIRKPLLNERNFTKLLLQQRCLSTYDPKSSINPQGSVTHTAASGGNAEGMEGGILDDHTNPPITEEPEMFSDIRLTQEWATSESDLSSKKKSRKAKNKIFQHFTPVYLTSYLADKEASVVRYIKLFDLYGEHILSNTPVEKRN